MERPVPFCDRKALLHFSCLSPATGLLDRREQIQSRVTGTAGDLGIAPLARSPESRANPFSTYQKVPGTSLRACVGLAEKCVLSALSLLGPAAMEITFSAMLHCGVHSVVRRWVGFWPCVSSPSTALCVVEPNHGLPSYEVDDENGARHEGVGSVVSPRAPFRILLPQNASARTALGWADVAPRQL
jgi:hypothetical protein